MPKTKVVFYQDASGECPVLNWLKALKQRNAAAYAHCVAKIKLLEDFGHELRRPAADYLRDGISELRIRHGNIQFRILYFFSGQNVTILAHSLIKKSSAVDKQDIERAIVRKENYLKSPILHMYKATIDED